MDIYNTRANGILMHISSLPGKFGIGTLGENAYKFVDFLKEGKQTYWQILPVCPTSYGDSPYQSFSTFAGNPYFIDLEILKSQGYLEEKDYINIDWGGTETCVDYGTLYIERNKVFKKIQKNFENNIPVDFEEFCNKNNFWLEDFSLFMAIKDSFDGKAFTQWPSSFIKREASTIEKFRKENESKIFYYKMLQYLFFKQWYELKNYANKNGIYIIGDIPIYVAADSSDVWTNPQNFYLDENNIPVEVAGCPPDGFSADGQLWGNPVYNWTFMEKDGYSWWKKRISESLKIYDVIRIDHFRGFDSFYTIKYGAENAKIGKWNEGPGIKFFNELKKDFGALQIIAEDLGFLTDSVKKLLNDSGFPGMKVLQFAFDSRETSDYLPFRYTRNCVVYTGTHDNDTICGWEKSAAKSDVNYAREFLLCEGNDLCKKMMLAAMSSSANTCILTLQDLIGLGSEGRMNVPSTVGTNWKWRAKQNELIPEISEFLKKYTKIFGR